MPDVTHDPARHLDAGTGETMMSRVRAGADRLSIRDG
jgi:hypothetical protein